MIYKTLKERYFEEVKGEKICVIHRYDNAVGANLNPWVQFVKGFFLNDIFQSPRGLVSAKFRKLGWALFLINM